MRCHHPWLDRTQPVNACRHCLCGNKQRVPRKPAPGHAITASLALLAGAVGCAASIRHSWPHHVSAAGARTAWTGGPATSQAVLDSSMTPLRALPADRAITLPKLGANAQSPSLGSSCGKQTSCEQRGPAPAQAVLDNSVTPPLTLPANQSTTLPRSGASAPPDAPPALSGTACNVGMPANSTRDRYLWVVKYLPTKSQLGAELGWCFCCLGCVAMWTGRPAQCAVTTNSPSCAAQRVITCKKCCLERGWLSLRGLLTHAAQSWTPGLQVRVPSGNV